MFHGRRGGGGDRGWWSVLTRFILTQQANQHMADMILTAEKDCQDTDLSRGVVNVEPIDGAVNGEIADAGQNIVACRATDGKNRQPVGRPSDIHDPLRGARQRGFRAFAEAAIAFAKMLEDQLEIALASLPMRTPSIAAFSRVKTTAIQVSPKTSGRTAISPTTTQ